MKSMTNDTDPSPPTNRLPDHLDVDDVDWPATIRLTVASPEQAVDDLQAAASEIEAGGSAEEAVRAFPSVGDLRRVLTDRRLDIVQQLMQAPAPSISALADRLDRSYAVVHDDVDVLVDAGIVHREENAGSQALIVPYEHVVVDVRIGAEAVGGEESSAAA
jgi:predicted transcriptional regulator